MSGDYSRVRFDPSLDLSGVLMQQGRVQLDSDWNEWVAALDRRLRAESVDTFGVQLKPGIPGVAVVSPQTPDAFKIEAADGSITIGRGRMYVDGLLAENHGDVEGVLEFDPVLAELRGQDPLPYDKQPYFPNPPKLSDSSGSYLAYLEVWQREATYHQLPGIVENAVGVDTTTRLQTVWQVRLLEDNSGAVCTTPDDEIPAWEGIINPSAGRMSIQTVDVKNDKDPCELPLGGGYRGLENQLYRIEIHDGGKLGEATFKWSRENASVESNVAEIISPTKLKLVSLGRDALLRFNTGDWVEILDDWRELGGEGGEEGDPAKRRGVMRQIAVDDTEQTISFASDLPPDLLPAKDTNGNYDVNEITARHIRVRRWDQKDKVFLFDDSGTELGNIDVEEGLIKVPEGISVWVALENGIQVQFSLDSSITGGQFRCGDYWVSAARTANASVERFTHAPPRGIHRHYVRLAMITFPLPETTDTELPDCRIHWPPAAGGCCTYTVGDGIKSRGHFNSIQDAVNALLLEEGGGRICVLPGTHYANVKLQECLNIHISGCGLQTMIFPEDGRTDEAIFQIDGCVDIQLRDLTLVAATGAAIEVLDTDRTNQKSSGITVEKNHIFAITRAIGIIPKELHNYTNAIRIIGNEIAMLNTEKGESAIYVAADDVLVEDNLIVVVHHSEKGLADDPDKVHLLFIYAKTAREPNLYIAIKRYRASGGIQIAGGSELVTIRRNRIVGGRGNGVTLGNIPPIKGQQDYDFLIDKLSDNLKAHIDDNFIPYVYDITIEENSISYMGLSGIAPPAFFKPNLIDTMPSVDGLTVYRNRIEHCLLQLPEAAYDWAGFGGIVLMDCKNVVIQENKIENNGSDQPKAACGILIFYGEKIDISGNRILNNGARAITKVSDGNKIIPPGWRGGLVILSAFAYLAQAVDSDEIWMAPDGIPAIKIHDNIITQPLGQALSLVAFGPVSVTGNQLTSQRAYLTANPLALLAGAVFILNLGLSKDLMTGAFLLGFSPPALLNIDPNMAQSQQRQADENPWLKYLYMPIGTVMFSNNQVLLDLRSIDVKDINFFFSSQLIASLDDVAYSNNQSECSSLLDFLATDVAIFAFTQRCSDNRFQEGFTVTGTSLFSFGLMNTAMGNQATHCLQVFGQTNFVKTRGNSVLFNAKGDCKRLGNIIMNTFHIARDENGD